MSHNRSVASLVVLIVLPAAASSLRADDDGPRRVPIYCPAIEAEDRPRTNSIVEPSGQPTLIVLGTARRAGKKADDSGDWDVEIEIEKTLFGSAPTGKLRCGSGGDYRPDARPQHLILALAPRLSAAGITFDVRYTLPPEEEKAVAALSAARMDYAALSSEIIFVGKEVRASANKGRAVEVLRVLHGPDSLKGKTICADLLEHPIRTDPFAGSPDPPQLKGEHLFFVATVDPEYKKHRFRSIANPDGPVYLVPYFLPADQEKNVAEALKRREQYPLVTIDDDGEKVSRREVLFRGSVAEAIELLGSESKGAVVLGGRFLIHHKKEARKPVLAAVEDDLLRRERKGGFRRLNNLIALLPRLSPETTKDDVRGLVERWLTHLKKNPPEPPAVKREPWENYFRGEENQTDVNHSLAWLLEQLDEEAVVKSYGKRLLALRDEASPRWKQEVQLALDVAKIEDHLELKAAWARLKDVRPLRSRSGMRHPGGRGEGVVAFTPDGTHLATVGGDLRVWRTKDWTLAAPAIPLDGSIERLVFSPDGKYLYVAGGGGGLQIHARYNWKTGRLDRAYKGHKSGLADLLLSADGKTMATSNYYEGKIHIWDTETGKIRKTFNTPHLACEIALSADGNTLLRRVAVGPADVEDPKTVWAVEALGPGALKVPGKVLDPNPDLFGFSDDGKYCLAVGRADGVGGAARERAVRLYDIRDGFREVAKTTVESLPAHRITFSSERRTVLLQGRWSDGDLHPFSLPDLKPLKGFEKVRERCGSPKSACFSPDGKLLAVGVLFRPTPHLFRTDTYEEMVPFEGHGENISEVFFPPGGKVLRTLGRDNRVCTWDARTLKMLRRLSLPAGWAQESSREPDGRYLIGSADGGDKKRLLQVFDVEADKVVASVKVPTETYDSLNLFWVNDREVYAVSGGELCHFDATTCRVLARRKFAARLGRSDRLTEDGKEFFTIDGGIPKYSHIKVRRISVESGKETSVGELWLRTFSGNSAGLVPGGKWFYIGDPGFYLFDSRTLKPVTSRAFRGTDSFSLNFTADGSRFAVATGGRIFVDRNLRQWDPQTQSVVRVHETRTGRTLGAFPASTRWVSVKFSPNGKQLAVTNDDGTFELWDLSALDRP